MNHVPEQLETVHESRPGPAEIRRAVRDVHAAIAHGGVPLAAILMSAGFFVSSAGKGAAQQPNKLIGLVWLGALSLAAGVLTLGIGLLTA